MDKIGIIADSHRADAASTDRRKRFIASGPRFYSEAEGDIEAAAGAFNTNNCDCFVQLGDFIDCHSDNWGNNTHNDGTDGEAVLVAAISDIETFTGPIYHTIGNWDMYDYDFQSSADWFKYIRNGTRDPETITEISATTYNDKDTNAKAARYYAFQCPNGTIGIVLDSTGTSEDGAEAYQNESTTKTYGAANRYVCSTQRTWLENTLAAHTDCPIVIFIHFWLYPVSTDYNGYMMSGSSSSVRTILEAYNTARIAAEDTGRVVAVFQGHHHPGGLGWHWCKDGEQDPQGYLSPIADFMTMQNNIKYFCCRAQIVGWGSDSEGATDDGAGGEATPANAYYIATVGEFVKGVYDVKVAGYGANPADPGTQSTYSYAVI